MRLLITLAAAIGLAGTACGGPQDRRDRPRERRPPHGRGEGPRAGQAQLQDRCDRDDPGRVGQGGEPSVRAVPAGRTHVGPALRRPCAPARPGRAAADPLGRGFQGLGIAAGRRDPDRRDRSGRSNRSPRRLCHGGIRLHQGERAADPHLLGRARYAQRATAVVARWCHDPDVAAGCRRHGPLQRGWRLPPLPARPLVLAGLRDPGWQ